MSKEAPLDKHFSEHPDEMDDWPSTSTTGAIIAAFLFLLGVIFVMLISKSPSGPSGTAATDTSAADNGNNDAEETATSCIEVKDEAKAAPTANGASATEGECIQGAGQSGSMAASQGSTTKRP